MKRLLIVGVVTLYAAVAAAQQRAIEGLPIKLGDSIETVKAALGTALEPEAYRSAAQRNARTLRLKTKGIWVFFDQDGRAYNIRLDAPFDGNVGGVKIGQTRAALVEKLGKPAKVVKGVVLAGLTQYEPYLYYIDDLTTVRFDFDRDGEIEVIYIIK